MRAWAATWSRGGLDLAACDEDERLASFCRQVALGDVLYLCSDRLVWDAIEALRPGLASLPLYSGRWRFPEAPPAVSRPRGGASCEPLDEVAREYLLAADPALLTALSAACEADTWAVVTGTGEMTRAQRSFLWRLFGCRLLLSERWWSRDWSTST